EDTAADRDPRLARVTGFLPGGAIGADLGGLLHVKSFPGLVVFERRALQIHSELSSPDCRVVRTGAPPYPVTQSFRVGLEPKHARRVRKHWPRIRLREN